MAKSLSPLRYPGGKSKIYSKVKNLIENNAFGDRTYVEPFAGGFGIGIALLCDKIVKTAVLNDVDSHIYHFWYSVFNHTEGLLKLITDTPVTIEEREKQRLAFKNKSSGTLEDGFSTLFLNRVNFSGVLDGGPIGGLSQNGTYKLDCRFNKKEITKRIEEVALLKSQVSIYNCDASELIINHLKDKNDTVFYNIDPPYVIKGSQLYMNYFKEDDHRNLEKTISAHLSHVPWIITYDDCDLIREIYNQYHMLEYQIQHNVGSSTMGKELVITNIPNDSFVW